MADSTDGDVDPQEESGPHTTEPANDASTPNSKRYGRIGVALAVILGLCWIGLVSSGTRIVSDPTDVDAADDRAQCQLVAANEVRCTAIFDATEAAVWTAVTDYESFNDTFNSGWGSLHVDADEVSENAIWLVGHLEGTFGTWPVEVTIYHEETPSGHRASWDESGDRVTTNQGRWELETSGDETKVIYSLEVVVTGAWRPMVNVALQLVGANVVEELRQAVDG